MSRIHFVLLDGDRVGDQIDGHYLRNDIPQLDRFARTLDAAVASLAASMRDMGGTVYLAGGDNVLGTVTDLDLFLARFDAVRAALPVPFSVGIGDDARQAYFALKVAKARGFGTIVRAETAPDGVRFTRHADGRWTDA